MDRIALKEILNEQELPTLPEVIGRIQEAYESESTTAGEMAAILESDHVIATRLLRLANSAYYGLQSEVGSVPRAVVVLGFTVVRDLALATAVFDVFARKKLLALDVEDLWLHCLGTAKASHVLARKHFPQSSMEGCFTAGLLHEVGKFLLALAFPDDYREVLSISRAEKRPLRDVEREAFQVTHDRVGALMLEEWSFPDFLQDVVGNLPLGPQYEGNHSNEVYVVSLGHEIAQSAGFGTGGDWRAPYYDPELLNLMSISDAVVNELTDEVKKYRILATQFFHILQQV